MENRFGEIIENYGKEYVLRQLAEECNELAQAALKLIRAWKKETPMREDEAYEHLVEELGDVAIMNDFVFFELLTKKQQEDALAIQKAKEQRMYDRLLDGKMEEDRW